MTGRGRPPKDGPRYPGGRLKPQLGGTPETVAHHLRRARLYHIPASHDPGMAETTIGVLEARGVIDADHARVLTGLRDTFEALFGRGVPSSSSIETVGRGRPQDRESDTLRSRWNAYKAAIAPLPRSRRDLFENVVLRNRYRDWMTYPSLIRDGVVLVPELGDLLDTVAMVVRRVRAERREAISDNQANALGLGRSLDELYEAKQRS